ncbi:Clavaminate synthase-like protein [Violaceomyces palustris]|uniref:Clavaminate synthase-like protein n=2 Tax=Violaceomyces palustris TaxID=1673888 RepID=A0ACD0P0G4_9BASI|nr:Clavaminate synthase-like protein [Violaceomyces palustris]PWN51569.1 Clavaminate synthase-like protein [Violaceomyces palustris]
MLSTLPSAQSHFNAPQGSSGGDAPLADQIAAQKALKSATNVLTSGQHDAIPELLTPYEELPKEITGPTVWKAEDYRGEENRHKWVHIWTEQEIKQLEDASNLWLLSGRELGEIERSTFPLPESLTKTLLDLRDRLVNGVGFYLFKGLPVRRWGPHLSAIAYLGLGSYLGNVNSQNGKGHVLGHVKDLGNDPTQIDKVRIYSTNAKQFFHTDSSGGLVGLLCLYKALEGGESDIVSSHAVWNELQRSRPDVARTLASNEWHFDRKGEVSEGENGWVKRPVYALAKGQPPNRLISQWDPYYIRSIGRHVQAGLIPATTPEQEEAMKVLEETAEKLSLHMILDVGDIQFVADTHVYHSRSAYIDMPPPNPRRQLFRLWLATPEGEGEQAGGWRTVYKDSSHPRRGGIQVNQTPPKCPLDGE